MKETWYVSKRMEIAGAHKLDLPYESKCSSLHGHSWIITVYCKSHELTDYGMIVDFAKVKEHIHGYLDHSYINEKFPDVKEGDIMSVKELISEEKETKPPARYNQASLIKELL